MSTRSLTSWSFCSFTMVILLSLIAQSALAQGTAFTYQGKLSDSGNPANGNYDLQFALFDMVSNGTQQGTTLTLSNVTVTNGVFTVSLDFGACSSCFNGAARFLEIAVRPSGGGSFTTLTPRQQITSTPYALKTSNLLFNGAYNNGAGTVFTATNTFAGEAAGLNTIPNPTLILPSGKFNAFFGAGAGQANTTGRDNAFFGSRAGFNHTTGIQNAFFGSQAGFSDTTGGANAFFGAGAGQANTTGPANSFFGALAGFSNTTGINNAFFGCQAGADNTTASSNSYFGSGTGEFNTTGSNNAFFGFQSGIFNTVGSNNAFFGNQAGYNNSTGIRNTFIGDEADFSASDPTGDLNTLLGSSAKVVSGVSNATAIGASAQVTQSNSLILGSINGVNGATADTNVGIGTTAPTERLHVIGNGMFTGNLMVSGILPSSSTLNIAGNGLFNGSLSLAGNTPPVVAPVGQGRLYFDTVTNKFRVSESGGAYVDLLSASSVFGSGTTNTIPLWNGGTTLGNSALTQSGANIGIGITTPISTLHVRQGDSGAAALAGSIAALESNGSGYLQLLTPNGNESGILFGNVSSNVSGGVIYNGGGTPSGLQFRTNGNVTKMVIDAAGNVGIGTAAPTAKLYIRDSDDAAVADIAQFFANNQTQGIGIGYNRIEALGSNTNQDLYLLPRGAGRIGIGTTAPLEFFHVFGDIRMGNAGLNGCLKNFGGGIITGTCASDARFKRDITPFPNLLSQIVQLRPVYFYWRSEQFPDRHFGQSQEAGLIAQEVEKVLPELVVEDAQGYKAVNYSKLPLLSIQAIKELKQENDQLKQHLTEQQNEIVTLKKRVEQVEALKRLVCKSNPGEEICKP